MSAVDTLKEILSATKIRITKYDPSKTRPITTNVGTMDARKFAKTLIEKIGGDIVDYPKITRDLHDPTALEEIIADYADSVGVGAQPDAGRQIAVPVDLEPYTLNVNKIAKRGEDDFFLTTKDEYISRTTGKFYMGRCNISLAEAFALARPVIPEYLPRNPAGIISIHNAKTKENESILNTYVPPEWEIWRKENKAEWDALPETAPPLVLKLLRHLLPIKRERQYLSAWLYASLDKRAYVYLVLCGAPGAGKNRLKLVMRALHGSDNTVDGKKSTLTDRFNSQLAAGTLGWFDELKHTSEMENVMKEIQNDFVSIERKGVDATRSSTIYTSMVISNNKPRDNYLAFDARKFAPLKLASNDLKNSMTSEEIGELTRKLEPRPSSDPLAPDEFDPKFVAQIAKWLLRSGKRNLAKWPDLEFRGPMFWTLAHTSMTRWQKKAVLMILEQPPGMRVGWVPDKGAYQWSVVENKFNKRNANSTTQFPDFTSIRAFFEQFRDGDGTKIFETSLIAGRNILSDFYIKPLKENVEIITEATVTQQRERERAKGKANGEEETYDL